MVKPVRNFTKPTVHPSRKVRFRTAWDSFVMARVASILSSIPPGFPVPGPGPVMITSASSRILSSRPSSSSAPSALVGSGPASSVAAVAKAKAKATAKARAKATAKRAARPANPPPPRRSQTGWLSVKFSKDLDLTLEPLAPSHPDFRTAITCVSWQQPPGTTQATDITTKKLAAFKWVKHELKDLGWTICAMKSSDSYMCQIKFVKAGTSSYKRRMAYRRLHVVATGTWPSF